MRAIKKLKILFLITITIFSFGLFDRIASAASDDVIVVVVPATPTGLSATPESCGYINITWNASPGATSYTLTDNWGTIYTGSSNSFRQAVTTGSAHTYRVLSSNAYGTSAYSAPVGAVGPSACLVYYSVTTSTSGAGGGTVTPSSRTVEGGTQTTFTITPNGTSYIESVTPSGCTGFLSVFTYYTGFINSNCNISVVFGSSVQSYLVSTNLTAGGSIDPTSRTVTSGSTTSFTITAYSGYAIDTAYGCQGSLSGSTYTTGAINANCTVYVTFRVVSPPSGTISASNCTIPVGSSSCNTSLSWNTSNPISTSAVTTPTNITVANANSGSTTYPVYYGSRTFYLYHNGSLLSSATASSACEAGSVWNGSICPLTTTHTLTVSLAGVGYGTVTSNPGGIYCGSTCSSSYAPSTNVELVAFPAHTYYFDSWSGSCTGNASCNVLMDSSKSVTASFSPVIVTVTASTPYYVAPSATVAFNYNAASNYDITECRLLDNNQSPLTSYQYHSSSSISYTVPASPNSYGYYVQCRDRTNTSVTARSSLVTVNVVTVSVTATTTYNTTPGANVSFAYTPSTTSGSTECALLNNTQVGLTPYQPSSPIVYAAPITSGSYGYYVRCRHAVATSVIATSSLITVNVACSAGTSWNGTNCVPPSGSISSTTCQIQAEENSCQTSLTWNTWYPIGVSAVTTNPSNTIVTTGNSGSGFSATVPYSSKTFYLYNNSQELSQTTASAVCTTGTAWSVAENKCKATTGTLYAGGCTIPVDQNSCPIEIVWETINPVSTSRLRNATKLETIADANSGSTTYTIPYGVTMFRLNHFFPTPTILKEVLSIAVCAPSTQWNSSTCQLLAPEIEDFYSASSTIFNGRSTTLHWDSNPSLVDSCVVTAPSYNSGPLGPSNPDGGLVITPTATTTYTLTCTRGSYSDEDTLVVKVLNMKIKEE